jgi:hypothetical protein
LSVYAIAIEEGIPALLVKGAGATSHERQVDAFRKVLQIIESVNAVVRMGERIHLLNLRAAQGY